MKMKCWLAAACNNNFVSSVTKMRPTSLNVNQQQSVIDSKKFLREAFHSWRTREICGIVPPDKISDLFRELNFSPTEKQVNDMLQTAKQFARRYNLEGKSHLDGLTFGEFCVLLADLRRFRTCNIVNNHDNDFNDSQKSDSSSLRINSHFTTFRRNSNNENNSDEKNTTTATNSTNTAATTTATTNQSMILSNNNLENNSTLPADVSAPEVFLGGSCNPTTWRADVAIPALKKFGISFYNPQVSDWTPDLIELEHRAKEKARVLFFVIDSETRATAGAIEAAHIAGQNSKQLVLVLHPYKPQQKILNEPISEQEYIDLTRNQNLLRELVIRRGLPILDSIPSGLQRTKAILSGNEGRNPPSNIASRLISVRRAFDRLVGTSVNEITMNECQIALSYLGYTNSILSVENLKKIINTHRELQKKNETIFRKNIRKEGKPNIYINFEEFCVITAYLSVLQQEINENTCVSPIKGTNLPPPPIFLTNAPEWIHDQSNQNRCSTSNYFMTSTQDEAQKTIQDHNQEQNIYNLRYISAPSVSHESQRKRDSGTSSPLPQEQNKDIERNRNPKNCSSTDLQINLDTDDNESTDSVFSSDDTSSNSSTSSDIDIRDIYLGGSCVLRTRWRQDYAIPLLKSRGMTFYLPDFGESITTDDNYTLHDTNYYQLSVEQPEKKIKFSKKSRVVNSTTSNYKSLHSSEIDTQLLNHTIQNVNNVNDGHNDNDDDDDDDSNGDVDDDNNDNNDSNNTDSKTKKNDIVNEDHLVKRLLNNRPIFNPTYLDSSRVLLFVITNETRSLAPMTLAAHYIGLGYDVVLCVQMLADSINGNERLTPAAVKDYNRGREYLRDLAKRQGIPVYSNIQEAIECAIEKANINKSIASI